MPLDICLLQINEIQNTQFYKLKILNTSLEDIILSNDKRGISYLRPHLPKEYCKNAVDLIPKPPSTIAITTGFYIINGNAPETDGPPGAICIGNALEQIGHSVLYITDKYTVPIMENYISDKSKMLEFPIMNLTASESFSKDILQDKSPSLLISVERCGASEDGIYRNMRDIDISSHTAKIDTLFELHPKSIGIGDGGNEIGLGNVSGWVKKSEQLVQFPARTKVTELILSSISNWGAYGLIAALSIKNGSNLLPNTKAESELIKNMVDSGAVDGLSGETSYKVDGFNLDEYLWALTKLNQITNFRLNSP